MSRRREPGRTPNRSKSTVSKKRSFVDVDGALRGRGPREVRQYVTPAVRAHLDAASFVVEEVFDRNRKRFGITRWDEDGGVPDHLGYGSGPGRDQRNAASH